jgi:hypothetical protein
LEMEGVSWIICLGWPHIGILLISASKVVRITDVSHWASLKQGLKLLILLPQAPEWWITFVCQYGYFMYVCAHIYMCICIYMHIYTYWGLNSGPWAFYAGIPPLEVHLQPYAYKYKT